MDDWRGHYRTTGLAIGFVGVLGLMVGATDRFLLPQDLGFINSDAIFVFSSLFLVVAAWMTSRVTLSEERR